MEPEESLPAVLRGETDVAVAHEYDLMPRPLDPLFERRDLCADPVLLAVPADFPLDGPVPLSSLAGQPFLAPREGTSCAEMIQRACARAGFVPRVVARATDFAVLLSLVAAGAGVTLVPALAAQSASAGPLAPHVRLMPPADPVTRQIFTVSRRAADRKPAVRVVLDALAAAAAETSHRISPCGTKNQASSLSAHRSQACASRSRSARVASPCSTARSPNGDLVSRSAHEEPHQARSCGPV